MFTTGFVLGERELKGHCPCLGLNGRFGDSVACHEDLGSLGKGPKAWICYSRLLHRHGGRDLCQYGPLHQKHRQVIDNVYHGVPGCIVVKASNKLYIDWVLLMVLDIGRSLAIVVSVLAK